MNIRTYLDHNATSPLRPEAREAMIAALDRTGNPSSIHAEGRAARELIENVREKVAQVFDVKSSAVTFTSGGTEAANWLLQPSYGRKLAYLSTEHPCVIAGHRFDRDDVRVLPVSQNGVGCLDNLDEALSADAIFAVQAANNETGVIQPLADIAEVTKAKDAVLVCDAVQAVGRLPLGEIAMADAVFFSAHKFGGPKGVGAVVLRGDRLDLQPLIRGGGQERRRRSGTENVSGIAGLGAALEAAVEGLGTFVARAQNLQSKLEAGLRSIASDAIVFGEGAGRLPNTTCFAIPGKSAEILLIALDLEGIAVSSGSACSSGKVEGSYVLQAMGVSRALSGGAIRVSTGWNTEEADIERFLTVLSRICSDRRERRAA
jgi:cysteine desulfurase